jgi:rod shape-determining protein MreC
LAWLGGFVGASLLVMALYATGYLVPVRDLMLRGMTPVQAQLARWVGDASAISSTLRDLRTLRQRNAELESQVNGLIIESVQLKEIEAENVNLRRLLNFAEQHPLVEFRGAQIAARIIGRDPGDLASYVLIDLGRDQGMREGMPVVTERGLVGRISRANSSSSQILLLTDPASAVNALIESSRLTGIVQGQVGGGLVMDYIPQDAEVTPGEIVITSGLGGVFPRNLVIGQVMTVSRRDYDMFQRAVVRPSVDFDQLEQVLVVTNFVPVEGSENSPGSPSGPS